MIYRQWKRLIIAAPNSAMIHPDWPPFARSILMASLEQALKKKLAYGEKQWGVTFVQARYCLLLPGYHHRRNLALRGAAERHFSSP